MKPSDPTLDQWRLEMGPTYLLAGTRPDGTLIGVLMTITLAGQIWVGDRWNVAERYSYPTIDAAITAYDEWCGRDGAGEPDGWIRHQPSNRRREDGDPNRETIRP
jgi:hypothetical protein